MIDGAERRMSPSLILKRASASRPSGEWNDDDYDVLADGTVVGRILKVHAAPIGSRRKFCMSARSQTSEGSTDAPNLQMLAYTCRGPSRTRCMGGRSCNDWYRGIPADKPRKRGRIQRTRQS